MTTETPGYADPTPRILVVDDEARIRDACRMVLEQAGYAVSLASDGGQGLAALEDTHFDIVLLDLMMPGVSGLEMLARVRAMHPDTALIVITGYATLEHSIEAMKKGAFDFIPKPFTPDHLRLTVRKAIAFTRALRDIAETRSRIRSMVHRLGDGVMCSNQDQRVVLVNPAFLRLSGADADAAEGAAVEAVVGDPELLEAIQSAWEAPAGCEETGAELVRPGDAGPGEVFVLARCAPFRDRAGRRLGVITVLHDITAHRRIDQMKSEFVSMVSHEIRSPMNAVMMQLQVILDGLAGEVTDKQREILERASGKIGSLVRMASELLDLARTESGLVAGERENVDLSEVAREQAALHRPRAEARGLRLELEAPDRLPPVLADRRNMEELLSNLIANAIQYTPEPGRIRVTVGTSDRRVTLRVADTGMGIAEEDRTRIFQRFYRVKDERTRRIQGTGLGLSLVQSIVDAHQGRIELNSRPGEGSTFTVLLPVCAEGDGANS